MAISNGPQLGVMIDAAAGDAHPNDFRKVLRMLDAGLFLSVKSMTVTAQPGSPADGDRYLLPGGQTGTDWAGKAAGVVAVYTTHNTVTTGGTETTTSIWEFIAPKRNWIAFVEDASDAFVRYTGTAWTGALRVANGLELPSGQVIKVNGVQVLADQQSGIGAALTAGTAAATYGTNEQAMLQEAHNKIRLLEVALRAHGMVTI